MQQQKFRDISVFLWLGFLVVSFSSFSSAFSSRIPSVVASFDGQRGLSLWVVEYE
jgi:hypothetical protein